MLNTPTDLVCIAHLRWNFVYQRPQHLMTRAAQTHRVFYVEEPIHAPDAQPPRLHVYQDRGVTVLVPHLPEGLGGDDALAVTGELLREELTRRGVHRPVLWMYTPMQLPMVEDLPTQAIVYDCMDELANFRHAPPQLRERERRLMERADVVFTGGHRLWEAKRQQHENAHPFPSSVDVSHFARARQGLPTPPDQARISGPRIGFYGVIDERFDIELLRELATRRPDWQFVLLGPTVKIDPEDLPRGANLHYLGMKSYDELPAYLSGWDVAILPFAKNEATEFISPTKTPEYLAGGVPVVSTSIRDVVRPWGEAGAVRIADGADAFEAALHAALTEDNTMCLAKADGMLRELSWDRTWRDMNTLIGAAAMMKEITNYETRSFGVADD